MIVVNNFTTLDDAGVGACLGRSPSARLGGANGHEVAAFVASEGVALRSSNADFPIQCNIIALLRRRTGRHTVPGLLAADARLACLVPIEQSQQQRQYNRNPFHGIKFTHSF